MKSATASKRCGSPCNSVLCSAHFKFSGFKPSKSGWTNFPSFRNKVPIKIDFSTALLLRLNHYHIPMDSGTDSVICLFISLPRGQMERSCYLLIKQNIEDWLCDMWIGTQSQTHRYSVHLRQYQGCRLTFSCHSPMPSTILPFSKRSRILVKVVP